MVNHSVVPRVITSSSSRVYFGVSIMTILFIIPKKSEYPFAIFASLTHVNQLKTRKKMKVESDG